MGKEENTLPRLYLAVLFPAVAFLGFILGTAFYEFKLWPSQPLRDAYAAAKAWNQKLKPTDRYTNTGFFGPAYRPESGIFHYNKEKAENGFTLFTASHEQKARLISMDGKIVHEWSIPFSKVWSRPSHIQSPNPDDLVVVSKAHVYPNGDLLAIYQGMNDTPYGYGLVKVDQNSQVIWKYSDTVHHDLDVGSDGKIYTLTQNLVKDKKAWFDDIIVVLSPDGKELKRVSVAKAFRNSEFSEIFEKSTDWDPLHTNTVKVLNAEIADKFPLFKKGQVLISVRNLNIVAVVDLEKEQIVWATRGGWTRQHDPDFLVNGNILLFDNLGHIGNGGKSQILEFNPNTMAIDWQYTGDEKNPFSSSVGSSQQRLPNGNTLITQTCYGRIFEVTPDGEIVWEYISPFRAPSNKQITETIYQAKRIPANFFKFQFSKLTANQAKL